MYVLRPAALKDESVTYDTITKAMGSHMKPERSPLLARCEFDGLVRGEHQKVQEYVAKINHQSTANFQQMRDCETG